MTYTDQHLDEVVQIAQQLDRGAIERMAGVLAGTRERQGRIFFLGVGGSAANCSHAVNDFRKIAGIEAYAPTDNVRELTARVNDEGWDTRFVEWLKVSRLSRRTRWWSSRSAAATWRRISAPTWCAALQHAKDVGARMLGIVGRDGGYTAQVAEACVLIPTVNAENDHPARRGLPGNRVAPARVPSGC